MKPGSEPIQLYRQIKGLEPNRPTIKRAFSSQSVSYPRGKLMADIGLVNKQVEGDREGIVMESEV